MYPKLGWGVQQKGNDLAKLEGYLAQRMTPVEPRPELIARLQSRLVKSQPEVTVQARADQQKFFLYGAAGIISSILLIITGLISIHGLRKMRAGRQGAASLSNAA